MLFGDASFFFSFFFLPFLPFLPMCLGYETSLLLLYFSTFKHAFGLMALWRAAVNWHQHQGVNSGDDRKQVGDASLFVFLFFSLNLSGVYNSQLFCFEHHVSGVFSFVPSSILIFEEQPQASGTIGEDRGMGVNRDQYQKVRNGDGRVYFGDGSLFFPFLVRLIFSSNYCR